MTDLSIKDVPKEQVDELRKRAKRNHRSIQGELRAMLDYHIPPKRGSITVDELAAKARAIGLKTPDEATRWIREDRDRR